MRKMNSWLWSPSSKGSPTAGCWQYRAAGVERFQRLNAENIPCLGNRALGEAAGLGLQQGCVSAKETSFFLVTPQSAQSHSPACFSKLIPTLYIDTHTERCVCLCIHPRVYTYIAPCSNCGGRGSRTAALPPAYTSPALVVEVVLPLQLCLGALEVCCHLPAVVHFNVGVVLGMSEKQWTK